MNDPIAIEISRADAEAWANEWTPDDEPDELSRMIEACREALKEEQ